jgi:hypothetical protein
MPGVPLQYRIPCCSDVCFKRIRFIVIHKVRINNYKDIIEFESLCGMDAAYLPEALILEGLLVPGGIIAYPLVALGFPMHGEIADFHIVDQGPSGLGLLHGQQGIIVLDPLQDHESHRVGDRLSVCLSVMRKIPDDVNSPPQQRELVGRVFAVAPDELGRVGEGEWGQRY